MGLHAKISAQRMHFLDLDRFVLRQPSHSPVYSERIRGARAIVDGYPRSGNTYATEIAQFVLKRVCRISLAEQVIHHFHEDLLVDIAVKYKIPSVFVIRRPIDAIISCCLFRLSEAGISMAGVDEVIGKGGGKCASPEWLRFLIEKECLRYLILYSKIIAAWGSIANHTRLISFDDFKNTPYCVAHALFSAMQLEMETMHSDAVLMNILQDKTYFLEVISNNARKMGKDVHQISAPRASADVAKDVLKDCIRMQQHDLIQRVSDVYDEIVDSSGVFMQTT